MCQLRALRIDAPQLRYWIDTQHFKPNGPIFLLDSGETNAIGRLPFLESGILSILSKATHGAGIVIEHRYYGHSMPTQNLSTDNLRFLSTEQAIMDLKYFVENVDLPGLGRINRTENPVILYGGSYAVSHLHCVSGLYLLYATGRQSRFRSQAFPRNLLWRNSQ